LLRLTGARLCVLGFGLCLSTACSRPLSSDECNQLLDHYTELLVRSANKDVSNEDLARLEREARAKAAADQEFARCSVRVSRRQWECAMKAPNVDDVERCLL
jgi:hypothetical protein